MQKEELEKIRQQMAAGKRAAQANPWAVDYNPELDSGKKLTEGGEMLVDKAKSYSF